MRWHIYLLIFLVIHNPLHALKASIFEHKCSATGQLSKIVKVHVCFEGTFLWPELLFYSSLFSQKRLRLLLLAVCYSTVNGLYIIEFDKTTIVKLHSGMVDQTFSHTRSGFPLFLSRMPIPARGEYKNEHQHVDPWRRCNVKTTHHVTFQRNSGFSGSLFSVFPI